jgi:nucleotide-binding universal stress UspA family protein
MPSRKGCESEDVRKGGGRKTRTRRTLLVPVDFTESSVKALDYALSLARRINATITLLHVLDGMYGEGFVDTPARVRERSRAIEDARLKLNLLTAWRIDRRVPMECLVRHGNVELEILRFAETGTVQLIVLGRKIRNALSRFVFGSVTKAVIETSPCPVIVVPEREGDVTGNGATRKT